MVVDGIFCDLHKAFYWVNYDILLSKFEFYGPSGKANNLIKSYLQDRYQRVLIDLDTIKYYSEWQSVTDGVPQGSILGPLHSTKFLGLLIDNNLLWHCHIDRMIPRLNKAAYVIRALKQVLSFESITMVYYSIFHSVMLYGIIFWAISNYSKIIFKIKKRVIRIITNSGNRDSHRDLFKKLNISPSSIPTFTCFAYVYCKE
jgi:hypothetical protein